MLQQYALEVTRAQVVYCNIPMTSSVRYGEALELNLLLRSINGPDMSFAHRPDYGFLLDRVL